MRPATRPLVAGVWLASFAGLVTNLVTDDRVLRPGGPLHLGFHVGDISRLKTEGYGGHPMSVHVHRRRPDKVASWLRDAGFEIDAQWLCDPDAQVPQAFLFARRPA
ncbi:hypothetical protein ACQPW3_20230 [Actinosynnema sp. CA-248983]